MGIGRIEVYARVEGITVLMSTICRLSIVGRRVEYPAAEHCWCVHEHSESLAIRLAR